MKKLRIMKKREKRLGFYLRLRQFFTDNFYFLRKKMHTLNCKRLLPIVVLYVTVKVHVGRSIRFRGTGCGCFPVTLAE